MTNATGKCEIRIYIMFIREQGNTSTFVVLYLCNIDHCMLADHTENHHHEQENLWKLGKRKLLIPWISTINKKCKNLNNNILKFS